MQNSKRIMFLFYPTRTSMVLKFYFLFLNIILLLLHLHDDNFAFTIYAVDIGHYQYFSNNCNCSGMYFYISSQNILCIYKSKFLSNQSTRPNSLALIHFKLLSLSALRQLEHNLMNPAVSLIFTNHMEQNY